MVGHWALPLLAAGGPKLVDPSNMLLSQDQLQFIVSAALTRLTDAGVDPSLVNQLASDTFVVGHLGGGSLGLTFGETHTVVISDNAAGYGWFVDPQPQGDTAFVRVNGTLVAAPGSPAAGSMDRLTVVLHEMGHLAGRPDLNSPADANDLMADMLSPGVRRDALDEFFAQGGL